MPRSDCPSPTSTVLLTRMKEPPLQFSSAAPPHPGMAASLLFPLRSSELSPFIAVFINYHKKPRTLGSFLMPHVFVYFSVQIPCLSPAPFTGFPFSSASSLNIPFIFLFRLKLDFSPVDTPFLSFSCTMLSLWFFFPYLSYI